MRGMEGSNLSQNDIIEWKRHDKSMAIEENFDR